jgi:hypothetical protein
MSLDNGHHTSVEEKAEVLPGPRVGVGTDTIVDIEGNKLRDDALTYIESEEGHDIRYKTLTWQKVVLHVSFF